MNLMSMRLIFFACGSIWSPYILYCIILYYIILYYIILYYIILRYIISYYIILYHIISYYIILYYIILYYIIYIYYYIYIYIIIYVCIYIYENLKNAWTWTSFHSFSKNNLETSENRMFTFSTVLAADLCLGFTARRPTWFGSAMDGRSACFGICKSF
jgi:hypothetical protein